MHQEIRIAQLEARIGELEAVLFDIYKLHPKSNGAIAKARTLAYDALPLHMVQQLEAGDDDE